MDLAFTDEQDMLRDAVRGLCADAADTVRSLEAVSYTHLTLPTIYSV